VTAVRVAHEVGAVLAEVRDSDGRSGEPRLLFAQLAFQHRDLMAQGEDSTSLYRSSITSSRSMANTFEAV
jgi:hypothetical protein